MASNEAVQPIAIYFSKDIYNKEKRRYEKQFELHDTTEWRVEAYKRDNRNDLISLTNLTKVQDNGLRPGEKVYSFPIENLSEKTVLDIDLSSITNINVVWWSRYLMNIYFVGERSSFSEPNIKKLQTLMLNYESAMQKLQKSATNADDNNNEKYEKQLADHVDSLEDGRLFLKQFKIELPAQGGRRKSRRTRRKSKRSKRTHRHRK